MELKEYRWKYDTNYQTIANEVGCSRGYVNLIAQKKIIPGKHLAKAIEMYTNGIVTVDEIMSEEVQRVG